jgi:rhodanese-related sulfurtransferase
MAQISEFVLDNLLLFAALIAVLVMLIKAELDHQANKGLFVSPSTAVRLMNNHSDTLILDVRTSSEFANGHIKGAKNVPLKEFSGNMDKLSGDKDKPVLLYCNSGSSVVTAINLLKKAGFAKINNLQGGLVAWKEANMPVAKK